MIEPTIAARRWRVRRRGEARQIVPAHWRARTDVNLTLQASDTPEQARFRATIWLMLVCAEKRARVEGATHG